MIKNSKYPSLSIIVPIFNAAIYLEPCLTALISLPIENKEIILIDDGSSDNSYEICKRYQKDHKGIYVISKKNSGVSSARNEGIKVAKGEYIYFCDADDIIKGISIIELLSYNSGNIDLLVGGYKKIESSDKEIIFLPSKILKEVSPLDYSFKLFNFIGIGYQGYLWNKIFKTDIIKQHNIKFVENISYNEDRLFILKYLSFCQGNILLSPLVIYDYFVRSSSAMGKIRSKDSYFKFEDDLEAFNLMYEEAKRFNNQTLLYLIKRGIVNSGRVNLNLIKNFSQDKNIDSERIKSKVKIHCTKTDILTISLIRFIILKLVKFKNIISSK